MDISVQKLLGKIDQEIMQAKLSNDEARLREKISSIKTLCELILDEPTGSNSEIRQTPVLMPAQPMGKQEIYPQQVQPASLTAKKINMNEEANGDSLFDF